MINTKTLVITPEILQIISEIDEFKGAWHLLGRLPPDRLAALRKVAAIESIGASTRIEGSKISNREVETLLSRLDAYAFLSRDEQDVAGYAFLCGEVFEKFETLSFTESTIKQFHGWILKFSDKSTHHRGEYKKLPNYVEAFDKEGKSLGAIFETPPPLEIPLKMQEFVSWTQQTLNAKLHHPLLVIGVFLGVFLMIHPFQEGNSHLSRVLTTLLLLKSGYAYVPYGSLESVIESNKDNYYLALKETQQTLKTDHPDWTPWVLYFLKSLQHQKRLLEQKIMREKALSLDISELSATLIRLTQEHGRLSIRQLEIMAKANRSTIKKHLQKLVQSNQLLRHGKGKASAYTVA